MRCFENELINSKELEFITGQKMPINNLLTKEELRKITIKQALNKRFLVSDIIKFGKLKNVSSNDPRYDGKEPIMFAVNQIRTMGLNRDIRESILSDKFCIQKQRLSSGYFILNAILTDAQLTGLYDQLKSKHKYHTSKSIDLLGGELPDFINFSNKTTLASQKDLWSK